MKTRLSVLLFVTVLVPMNAWAWWGVNDTNMGISPIGTVATEADIVDLMGGMMGKYGMGIVGGTSLSSLSDNITGGVSVFGQSMGGANLNKIYGGYLAGDVSGGASLGKIYQQQNALLLSQEMTRDYMIQKPKYVNLSPKELWAKVKKWMSGDFGASARDSLQDTISNMYEKIANTFTEEMLDTVMANLIQDIMSCQTPQLDVLFPNIDLNLGFAMCDYKKMFDNMKDQTKRIADRGWGGSFTVNGHSASDIIKDPGLLKDSIKMVSPGQGHALVANLFSEESRKAALQLNVDTSALGQQLAQNLKRKEYTRMIKPRTIIDGLDDSARIQAVSAQMQATGNVNLIKSVDAGVQLQAQQMTYQEQKDQQASFSSNRESIRYNINRY